MFQQNLSCAANKSCEINTESRRNCPACRFNKCLEVGMKPDIIEVGASKSWTKDRQILKTNKIHQVHCYLNQSPNNIETDAQQKESERALSLQYHYANFAFSTSLALPLIHYDPSRHEYLRIRRSAASSLQYNFLNFIAVIPCTRYDVVIEVPVKNGVICGTDILLDNLVNKNLSIQPNRSLMISRNSSQLQLHFPLRRCHYTFTRKTSSIEIQVSSSSREDVVHMSCISDDHWYRIQQIISATEHFESVVSTSIIIPSNESSSRITGDNLFSQQIILSQTSDAYTKQISNLIESFEAFHELDLLDQLIVLKEALFPIHFLLSTYCYFRETNCISYSTLGGHILYGYNISKWTRDNYFCGREMIAVYESYLSEFLTFLREDYFFMKILCVLYIFRDWPGLSCTEVTERERKLLSEILDKYIDGMNAAGLWSTPKQLVWSNIERIFKHVFHYKQNITRFQKILAT